MKEQRYGIEIEMTGITRKEAADAVAKLLNGTNDHTYGGYDTYEVKAPDGRVWKLMSDSSIREESTRGRATSEHRVELVSPICRYADIETIQEIVRTLRKAGAKVNASCGLHIHIDASAHNARSLKNLANIVASKESLLFKALAVDDNRENYCKKADKDFMTTLNAKRYADTEAIKRIWYKGYNADCEARQHYSNTRYRALKFYVYYSGTLKLTKVEQYY